MSLLLPHRGLRLLSRSSIFQSFLRRDISIGILRECFDKWERRVPLTPNHVRELIDSFKGDKKLTEIYVQPSQRIFPNSQYADAGAIVTDDLSDASILLGVKRVVNEEDLIPNKTYMFFAHVIKGQTENMPLLQAILDKNIQLFDYEAIAKHVEDPTTGGVRKQRIVAFGKYAGLAGMIETFQCLGRRLLASAYSTPFLNCSPAYVYYDLDEAKQRVHKIGEHIKSDGLPSNLEALVFAFTGRGNVTKGALEIFKLLPHEMITLEEAKEVKKKRGPHHCVYGVMIEQKDIVRRKPGFPQTPFDVKHYRENPSEYGSTFANNVAPFCNVIVNGIYWDERYPRLLTKEEITSLWKRGYKSLFAVGDISCDINGSIEFLEYTTSVDKPFFLWNPLTNEATDEITSDGVAVMGVDILPTEISVESSEHFSESLLPLLKQLIANDHNKDDDIYANLPPELANACITQNGSLTKNFQYIDALMKRRQSASQQDVKDSHVLIHLRGHLFDSGLINQVLDVIEGLGCNFAIEDCNVKPTINGIREKTSLMLRVFSAEKDKLDSVLTKVKMLCDLIQNAEASMQHYDSRSQSALSQDSPTKSRANVLGETERNILLLGAGKVAKSFAEYAGRSKSTTVTVASQFEHEAMSVAKNAKRGKAVTCDLMHSTDQLRDLIKEADVVVSLLPAQMHPIIAKECISLKTDLVTASYESEEMRTLRDSIEEAGISILNEVGLDPGIDHMSAMRIIDNIHSRGGVVKLFSSACGGLPAPEAANNPLLYKFSWSPMGVIMASQNSAVYRRDDETVQIPGDDLLTSSEPYDGFQSLNLEQLPNRDSLVYGEKYGIQSAHTIFRGTLRYNGFSALLYVFKNMGLLNNTETGAVTWKETIEKTSKEHGFPDVRSYILSCAENDKDLASRAHRCLEWLHINDMFVSDSSSVVRSFCHLLEQNLAFVDGERDMVLMQHQIVALFSNGRAETHSSSLQLFGDERMTAMCKTVGYTAAIGTKLILDGLVPTKGLLLPTSKEVYIPALDLLEKEGIVFDENVHIEHDQEKFV